MSRIHEHHDAPILAELAARTVQARTGAIPQAAGHAANRALVDWYAAAVSGGVEPPARILSEVVLAESVAGHSCVVPSGRAVPARPAALINATAAHTTEIDDIFRDGMYHPGAPTIAAALAVAEEVNASGADLLRAIVLGFEVGCRLAQAVAPSHYRFWHPTGTIGALGATVAAADLYDLDADRLTHALATATTMAAGLQQAFRGESMSKPLHAGRAAETGVFAAATAARGFTGTAGAFDGEAGLAAAMSADADLSVAARSFGEPFAVGSITVKNHACCGHTFAAVDAALELRSAFPDLRDIERIEIDTYRAATITAGHPRPETAFEAKFSLAYCVAAALGLGTVRAAAFEPSALADPLLRRLVERTVVRVDGRYEKLAPNRRAARVTVSGENNGRRSAERLTRRGDPDEPLSDAELSDKFVEFTQPVLGGTAARDLLARAWRVSSLRHVRDLNRLPASTENRVIT
ncbi:MmgE/PrpD family protein [Nonomuraea sp. B5E05]|uniref:MmgE/PrpD family protein n=1 Tax=Nonomuraea sp. B5E05 TaxID=3153569 RepID=UPI00326045BB